jgi:feruloyl esterase
MRSITLPFLPAACALLLFSSSAIAQSDICESLKRIALDDTVIRNAEMKAAGSASRDASPYAPPPPDFWTYPEYCQVEGAIHPRTSADGKHYEIQFELRLPSNWNGKFLFQGGGGTDGMVRPAMGMAGMTALPALSRGYAVVSTDAGHQGGMDTSFGREQQARLDYAQNAIGEVTHAAKKLLAAYYQKPAQHSYFVGCSNGGRQAMMAAQRYPLEFDGVVAGDPGFHLSHAAIGEAWDTAVYSSIAPTDAQQRPILSKAFSSEDLNLLSKAVLDQCDALDGLKDGEILNVAACKFDSAVLECKGAKTPACLNHQQVEALQRSFGGAHDSNGNQIYAGWPYDVGISDMGWRMWKLGTSETAESNAINALVGAATLKDYFVHPFIANLDPVHLDFDKIAAQVEETHELNDPTSTDISSFTARGGRMIIYQGVSDPVFSTSDILDYYNRYAVANGGLDKARISARLFLIPGMTHCSGGPATDEFDPLDALEKWVENGTTPEHISATGHTFPHRTRPLCAYPQYASYNGSGDPEDEKNFTCK